MGDLKSPWDNPGTPTPDLSGQGVVSRGSDPNIDMGGPSALQGVTWASPPVATPGGEETANSVSGLPLQPNRFEPSGTPPEPPNLTDRNPGMIDKT